MFELKWEIEGRVLHLSYFDAVELSDIQSANEKIFACYEKAEQKVHVLIHVTDTKIINFTLSQLLHLDILKKNNEHPMQGYLGFYNRENAFMLFFAKAVNNVFGGLHNQFDDKAKALAYFRQHDETL